MRKGREVEEESLVVVIRIYQDLQQYLTRYYWWESLKDETSSSHGCNKRLSMKYEATWNIKNKKESDNDFRIKLIVLRLPNPGLKIRIPPSIDIIFKTNIKNDSVELSYA